jgi:protein-tyrosine phosphatase
MVWPFKTSRPEERRPRDLVPAGFVDAHCHVLPGLDDGPRAETETRRMLDAFGELGYARLAATPHWNHAGFETPERAQVERAVATLNAARAPAVPTLVAGAEIAFDDRFFPSLEAGTLPGLGAGAVYLVELPAVPGSLPRGFEDAVFRFAAKGATLVLAHAERIPDLRRETGALARLRTAGALAQIDLTSLVGKHGATAREWGWRLVESGEADIVGSDAHSADDLPLVERALVALGELGSSELERLASSNPASLLDGAAERVVRHA